MLRVQTNYIDYASTDCDSSEERDYDFSIAKTNPLKHKTELCKTYSELGYCNYGQKCRFAHGRHQLVAVSKNVDLRQRKCNGFWGKCHCNYGIRCQFGHSQLQKSEDQLIMQVAKAGFRVQPTQSNASYGSKLMRLISHQ